MTGIQKKSIDAPKSFREIRYEEKRAAIIMSAAKAFGRKGFHAATIEDITNELKMTKGSLYYYFSTKEELLFETHILSLEKVLRGIIDVIKTDASPVVKIRNAIISHMEILAKEFEGAFLLQQEFHLPKDYKREVISMRDEYEKAFVQILQDGVDDGSFRNINPRLTAYVMLGSINWFLRWYSSSGSNTVEEIIDQYIDLFCNGLLASNVGVNS